MKLAETSIAGVYVIEPEPAWDERGFFARMFCASEFARLGLNPLVEQVSVSFNAKEGTLRGMHYQAKPHEEAKLVRVTRGAIFDVAVDTRQGSGTYGRWTGHTLTSENRHGLWIPEGCAHGFITLEENTEIIYQISVPYEPSSARGFAWNDPAVGIQWPRAPRVVSKKDQKLGLFNAL